MLGLNIGSGQRRFDNMAGWINIDCVSRDDQVPDLICDVGKEKLPFEDGSVDYCVLHQVYEHFGLGEGHGLIRECYRVLKPGGSLIVTVPDIQALAQRWLLGSISDYIFFVNVYGAFQGEPGDRHKWGYRAFNLTADIQEALVTIDKDLLWARVKRFDWREITGASIAQDFWILGVECVK